MGGNSPRSIKVCDRYNCQFGSYALFGNVAISVIFSSFFIITFNWKGNFDTIFIQVYTNLGSISLTVWKLCAFRQRSNFRNFQQFFHHNFRLKILLVMRYIGKFVILMLECIGIITSKYMRLKLVFIKKNSKLIKNRIFLRMRMYTLSKYAAFLGQLFTKHI